MTKATLHALWLGGGGVLATWLAVTPHQGAPSAASTSPAATREATAEDLNAQADRLRARTQAVRLIPSTRNPFRFHAPKAAARVGMSTALSNEPVTPMMAAEELPPSLSLSGVAEQRTPQGVRRTAVLSGDGQIYLAGEGDSVAGSYIVVTVDPEAVVLRDANGDDLRLTLP